VNIWSDRPEFTAIFVKRMVTVFSNWSYTTALRTSHDLGSSERMRRVRVGISCLGARSSTMLPSASVGWAGLRNRTPKCSRSRPRPARKLPAGPDSASGASPTFTWLSEGV
jgi:hypothetical protein